MVQNDIRTFPTTTTTVFTDNKLIISFLVCIRTICAMDGLSKCYSLAFVKCTTMRYYVYDVLTHNSFVFYVSVRWIHFFPFSFIISSVCIWLSRLKNNELLSIYTHKSISFWTQHKIQNFQLQLLRCQLSIIEFQCQTFRKQTAKCSINFRNVK